MDLLLRFENAEAFNKALRLTRVKIECAFGRLKRFLILYNQLRIFLEKATVMIGACIVLHNIAIDLQMPDMDEPFLDDDTQALHTVHSNRGTPSNGFEMLVHIARTYFPHQ